MKKTVPSLRPHRQILDWRTSINRLCASIPVIGVFSALLLGGTHSALAANDAWSTAPANGTFTGINWTLGTNVPGAATGTIAAGDALYFGTSSITTLNDDEAAGFGLASFNFNAGASAYTIGGNSINLTGNITNNSSVLQTINDALTIAPATTFSTLGGNLTLGGNITGTGLGTATLATGGGTVTLGGTNSFTTAGNVGNALQVTSLSTLAITGTTGIAVSAGDYFSVGQGNAANAGTVTVASGGTLNVTGSGRFIVGTFTTGTFNVNGTANFLGGTPLRLGYNSTGSVTNLNAGGLLATASNLVIDNVTTGSAATFNFNGGTLRAGAAGLTLLGASNLANTTVTTSSTASTVDSNGFASTVALPIGNGTTAGGLTIVDSSAAKSGSVTLSGISTYTGGTVVNSGNLILKAGGGAGAVRGALTVNPGATLTLGSNNNLGYTAGTQVTTLNINGGTVNTTGALGDEGYLTSFNLTGGTLAYTGTNATNAYQIAAADATAPGITSNASATTSLISGNVNIRSGTLPITVAQGTTASGVDLQVSGVISGTNFGVTKSGPGMLALSGANTYTGATTVNAGTLLVTGSTATGSVVTVNNAGTRLGGTGTIGGNITVNSGSILFAGNPLLNAPTTGILTTGALTLATGSTFNALLASNTNFSQLIAVGTTSLANAAFSVSLINGATFTNNSVLSEVIDSNVSSAFTNATYTAGGYTFTADYATDPGFFDLDVTAVPEPSTWAAGAVMLGLFGVSRRRQVSGWLRLARS